MGTALRFALPPSLGKDAAAGKARELESYLTRHAAHPIHVVVSSGYDVLAKDLLAGRVDAAWAPPFVCARVEAMGARVALRGVRAGASSYRAALVCRADEALTLAALGGKVAAWADPDSVGGHLLAVAFLRQHGLEASKIFFRQQFEGSYRAALEAVANGRADLTSVFAPLARPGQKERTGIPEITPELQSSFRVIAFTDESPNDGVAVAMASDAQALADLEQVLMGLSGEPEGRRILQEIFGAESFEPAPRLGYRALYRVALASL
jgi:phosphonate transport system substrate-binding protein